MTVKHKNGVEYIKLPVLDELDFIKHGISTRIGGVSKLSYTSSLNLGLKTDDSIDTVKENYKLFCEATGLSYDRLVHAKQTHSDNIRIVTEQDIGKGLFKERDYNEVDGMITTEKNIPLVIVTADCVPVLFADKKTRVIGGSHCGRVGTQKKLSYKMIQKFIQQFNSNAENICVGIAPAIGFCCYEVSEELYNEFSEYKNFIAEKNGKFYLDLPGINKYQLLEAGVKEENIYVSNFCTKCNSDVMFSHRALGFKRGMIASAIERIV